MKLLLLWVLGMAAVHLLAYGYLNAQSGYEFERLTPYEQRSLDLLKKQNRILEHQAPMRPIPSVPGRRPC